MQPVRDRWDQNFKRTKLKLGKGKRVCSGPLNHKKDTRPVVVLIILRLKNISNRIGMHILGMVQKNVTENY